MQKTFQDLNIRAEEGDMAITSSKISRFKGFGYRGYNCVFPDVGDIAVVENVGEALQP